MRNVLGNELLLERVWGRIVGVLLGRDWYCSHCRNRLANVLKCV